MRTGLIVSGRVALLLLIALLSVAGGCGPVWWMDPNFAERLAKKENKPILYYFKEWDSTQHRNMWWNVFENAAVKKELKDTINVDVLLAWYPDYKKRFQISRPQVCVMCKPNGEAVHDTLYVNPVPKPEEFLRWLRRAKAEAMPKPASRPTTSRGKAPARRADPNSRNPRAPSRRRPPATGSPPS